MQDLAGFFVDRRRERHLLRGALTDRETRVIVVHGPAGVGKTELVRRVLNQTGIDYGWHLVTPTFSPTVDTLMGELDPTRKVSRESVQHLDESPAGHLESVLRHREAKTHVIVFDSAERLLGDDGQLTDLSLDEAMDLVSTDPRHGVKIVLVTKDMPKDAGGEWVARAEKIPVDGLPLEHFRTFAAESARGRTDLLASLADGTMTEVHRDLGGRPRLAQIFDAIIECDRDTTAPALVAELHRWAVRADKVDTVGDRLRQRMTGAFRYDRRRVYRAVAALGTPADVATIAEVVNADREPDERLAVEHVRRELNELSRHAILSDRDASVFFLTADEARRVLEWKDLDDLRQIAANRQLLSTAAEVLRKRRRTDRCGDWADPQAWLAEVDAWLRADLPDAAFRSIEEMDTSAALGSPSMLFRKPRQNIANQIVESERAANYNVLGYLYHAAGDFGSATEAYRSALAQIPRDGSEAAAEAAKAGWRAKVYVNRGGVRWAQGHVEHAFGDFDKALRLAGGDPAVAAGALGGMSRCRRRDGRFTEAMDYLNEALGVAGPEPRRMIPIAVRMARLYVECRRFREAGTLIERIREGAERADDNALRAAHLDALGDLRLAEGQLGEAVRAARQAVRLALPVHDPVTALQARSTISAVCIHQGKFPLAAREATLARRYSGSDALIVIALQGTAYRRAGQPDDARRAFDDLFEQAGLRISRNDRDFAARTLLGFAICARVLDSATDSVVPAIESFQRARQAPAEPAPTFNRLMVTLLHTLATDAAEHQQLQPAIDDLQRSLVQQRRTL